MLKAKLEELKTTAVMYPTMENLKNYIALQNQVIERSGKFQSAWDAALRQYPELDYRVKNPMSTIGNELTNQIKISNRKEILASLNKRYGMFFFYSTTCIYCLKFSSVLKIFSDQYQLNVLPVSMDGNYLPEWPNSKANKGKAAKLGMEGKPIPAVMLFDSITKQVIPVSFGLITVDELEERVTKVIELNEGRQE